MWAVVESSLLSHRHDRAVDKANLYQSQRTLRGSLQHRPRTEVEDAAVAGARDTTVLHRCARAALVRTHCGESLDRAAVMTTTFASCTMTPPPSGMSSTAAKTVPCPLDAASSSGVRRIPVTIAASRPPSTGSVQDEAGESQRQHLGGKDAVEGATGD
jgi:hypothetical protein